MWNIIQFVFYLIIGLCFFYFVIYKEVKKNNHPTTPFLLFALTLGFSAISVILAYDASYGNGETLDSILTAISTPFSSEVWSNSTESSSFSFTQQLSERLNQVTKVLVIIIIAIVLISLARSKKNGTNS